jgi:hypothetical protein
MSNPLCPDISLLVSLGSLIVHADEFMSADGSPFDRIAFDELLKSDDVQKWLAEMTKMALLPVKRKVKPGDMPFPRRRLPRDPATTEDDDREG